jgi:tetratricopeptide (TPR) repeat protein
LFRFKPSPATLRYLAARQATVDSVMEAHRRGDYATALERAEGFRIDGNITADYCFHRGGALRQLGRNDEAEKWLRRRVAMPLDDKRKALSYSVLGHVLLSEQRYEEAMDCFTTCLRLWPERGSSRRNVAEAFLRRGDRPGEALKWAREAVAKERTVHPSSEGLHRVHTLNLSEQLATLAWAVAVNTRDRAEVDSLMAEAVALVGDQSVESAGLVHCQAGHAYAALGDTCESERYFEIAARIDPQGRWGREARRISPGVGR